MEVINVSFSVFHVGCSYKTPGPGTYEVTKLNTNKKRMPAYTINGRNYMPQDSTLKPGPGQHRPEKVRNYFVEHHGACHGGFQLPY